MQDDCEWNGYQEDEDLMHHRGSPGEDQGGSNDESRRWTFYGARTAQGPRAQNPVMHDAHESGEDNNRQRASALGLPQEVAGLLEQRLVELEDAEEEAKFQTWLDRGNTPEHKEAFSRRIKALHEQLTKRSKDYVRLVTCIQKFIIAILREDQYYRGAHVEIKQIGVLVQSQITICNALSWPTDSPGPVQILLNRRAIALRPWVFGRSFNPVLCPKLLPRLSST